MKHVRRALAERCMAGDCDHTTAAKLVGVRRSTWDSYVRQIKVERRVHAKLVAAFHHVFPECNPHLAMTARDWHERVTDNLLRGGPAAPCVTYTAEEAAKLPPSQPHILLAGPDKKTEGSRYNGPVGKIPDSAADSVAEDVEADRYEHEVLDLSGPEFRFAA